MLVFYLSLIDEEKDKDKFEELYHSYKNQMTYVAMSVLHNETDAEDIVHDVFVKVATRHMDTVNQFSDEVDLRNYMLKATKNTAINWKEKRKDIYTLQIRWRRVRSILIYQMIDLLSIYAKKRSTTVCLRG